MVTKREQHSDIAGGVNVSTFHGQRCSKRGRVLGKKKDIFVKSESTRSLSICPSKAGSPDARPHVMRVVVSMVPQGLGN